MIRPPVTRPPTSPPRSMIASAFVAFAAFGSFWGVWGASVPRVQHQAGINDGQLGFALLFVGAGALPAMLLAGRALDRWGLRVAALLRSHPRGVGDGAACVLYLGVRLELVDRPLPDVAAMLYRP